MGKKVHTIFFIGGKLEGSAKKISIESEGVLTEGSVRSLFAKQLANTSVSEPEKTQVSLLTKKAAAILSGSKDRASMIFAVLCQDPTELEFISISDRWALNDDYLNSLIAKELRGREIKEWERGETLRLNEYTAVLVQY